MNNYNQNETFIVGGLDSMGVPYTYDNDIHKSYIELTVDKLKEMGINVSYYNISSLGRNKTWELQTILDRNYTIGMYEELNRNASKYVIGGGRKASGEEGWPFPTNPYFIDEFYHTSLNQNIKITSALREASHPIFLYSCGGMNIRTYLYIKSNPTLEDVKNVTKEVLTNGLNDIERTENDIDETLNYILDLNPNMEIYVLGVYAMLDKASLRAIAFPLVNLYNNKLKQIIDKYPTIHYVDTVAVKNMVAKEDMHPNLLGQEYIAKQLTKVIVNNSRNL